MTNEANMYFSNNGLNLIRINEQIDDSLIGELIEIDRSTIEGDMEYFNIRIRALNNNERYTYKKLKKNVCSVDGLGNIKKILVALSKDNIVRRFIIDCSDCITDDIKGVLIRAFGNPEIQSDHGINGYLFHSYMWVFKSSDFCIFLSGITNKISFGGM